MGFIVTIIIFMNTYLHPVKPTIVEINYYNKANIEFILFLILLPCVAFTSLKYLRRL